MVSFFLPCEAGASQTITFPSPELGNKRFYLFKKLKCYNIFLVA